VQHRAVKKRGDDDQEVQEETIGLRQHRTRCSISTVFSHLESVSTREGEIGICFERRLAKRLVGVEWNRNHLGGGVLLLRYLSCTHHEASDKHLCQHNARAFGAIGHSLDVVVAFNDAKLEGHALADLHCEGVLRCTLKLDYIVHVLRRSSRKRKLLARTLGNARVHVGLYKSPPEGCVP
jgi:hypothetical protein